MLVLPVKWRPFAAALIRCVRHSEDMPYSIQTPAAQGASWLAFCGLAAFPLLLPFARLSEFGILLCLIAITWGWRNWRAALGERPVAAVMLAWALVTLAAVLSSIDAWAPRESWSASVSMVRFAALPLAAAMLSATQLLYLARLVAGIAALWALDAVAQAALGISLGGASNSDRISGVFGDDNLKLGLVLPLLAPMLLVLSEHRKRWCLLAWLLLAASILMAGARAGWIMFLLLSLAWCYRLSGNRLRKCAGYLTVATLALGMLVGVLYLQVDRFAERVNRTAQAFNGSGSEGLDFALAGRLPIWQTAIHMSASNPINGVGVRGFRYAYPSYAQADDRWVSQTIRDGIPIKTGATHPHQLFLELSSETGLLGVALWLLAAIIVVHAYRRTNPATRAQAWPFVMAVFILIFPFNTHTAFYSSFWAGVFWWLLALMAASLREPKDGTQAQVGRRGIS